MDDPLIVTRSVRIPLDEITLRTSRSSGPGGQHANVTASRVEAVFDVASSSALSDTQKRRVIAKAGGRITATAQDARSQARNRQLAIERLRDKLRRALAVPRTRKATRPTKASKRKRLDDKRKTGERKRDRQRPSADD